MIWMFGCNFLRGLSMAFWTLGSCDCLICSRLVGELQKW